jgi:hypothetical protein
MSVMSAQQYMDEVKKIQQENLHPCEGDLLCTLERAKEKIESSK